METICTDDCLWKICFCDISVVVGKVYGDVFDIVQFTEASFMIERLILNVTEVADEAIFFPIR